MGMKIVLAGGSGFIGHALVRRLLEEKHSVTVLSRRTDAFKDVASNALKVETWDGRTTGAWASVLEGSDAVVNLAGESIAQARWTEARKKALRDSRLDSTRVLAAAVLRASQRPRLFINASAVGYYGNV